MQKLVTTNTISEEEKLKRITRFTGLMSSIIAPKKTYMKKKGLKHGGKKGGHSKVGKSGPIEEDLDPQASENDGDDEHEAAKEAPTREVNRERAKDAAVDHRGLGADSHGAPTKTLKKRPGSAKRG